MGVKEILVKMFPNIAKRLGFNPQAELGEGGVELPFYPKEPQIIGKVENTNPWRVSYTREQALQKLIEETGNNNMDYDRAKSTYGDVLSEYDIVCCANVCRYMNARDNRPFENIGDIRKVFGADGLSKLIDSSFEKAVAFEMGYQMPRESAKAEVRANPMNNIYILDAFKEAKDEKRKAERIEAFKIKHEKRPEILEKMVESMIKEAGEKRNRLDHYRVINSDTLNNNLVDYDDVVETMCFMFAEKDNRGICIDNSYSKFSNWLNQPSGPVDKADVLATVNLHNAIVTGNVSLDDLNQVKGGAVAVIEQTSAIARMKSFDTRKSVDEFFDMDHGVNHDLLPSNMIAKMPKGNIIRE